MRYILIFFAVIILSSCSSTPESNVLSEPALTSTAAAVRPVSTPLSSPANAVGELRTALASGNSERVKSASTEVLLSNPRDVNALNGLATYYYGKNQLAASEFLLRKALVQNSKSAILQNNLGLVLLAKNEKRDALLMFRRAMDADPSYYPAATNAAALYAKEKDYSKVIFSLEAAVKNNRADDSALNNYAVALAATGKHAEAAEIYEKLLQKNPNQREVLLNYSILSIEKLGKYQQGLDLLDRLKFVGSVNESLEVINDLEVKAKAGLK